jgi:HEAT repeat protein
MRNLCFLTVAVSVFLGCEPMPQYEGKSMAVWKKELKSKDPMARWRAAAAISVIGPKARGAIPDLIKLLGDGEYFVRYEAAQTLGKFGPASRAAVPDLIKLLKDPNIQVRDAAGLALKKIDPEAAEKAKTY